MCVMVYIETTWNSAGDLSVIVMIQSIEVQGASSKKKKPVCWFQNEII